MDAIYINRISVSTQNGVVRNRACACGSTATHVTRVGNAWHGTPTFVCDAHADAARMAGAM